LTEWTNFVDYIDRNNEGRKSFDFSIVSSDAFNKKDTQNSKNYTFQYDLDLFDSYDGSPIKQHDLTLYQNCDVILGEFFMSRYPLLQDND